MNVPDDLRYSVDHEWARREGGKVRVGITDYAQDALGDIVFVDLPTVGDRGGADGTFGEVESTKSVSDLVRPGGGHGGRGQRPPRPTAPSASTRIPTATGGSA